MKFERNDYIIEVRVEDDIWIQRGTSYKDEEEAVRWFEHLKERWPGSFRLISKAWYTDRRVIDGGTDEQSKRSSNGDEQGSR